MSRTALSMVVISFADRCDGLCGLRRGTATPGGSTTDRNGGQAGPGMAGTSGGGRQRRHDGARPDGHRRHRQDDEAKDDGNRRHAIIIGIPTPGTPGTVFPGGGPNGMGPLAPGCTPGSAHECPSASGVCATSATSEPTGTTSGSICFYGPITTTTTTTASTPAATIEYLHETAGGQEYYRFRIIFDPAFVDNTYGVNAIGWVTKGHTFKDLVGSDHAELSLFDGTPTLVSMFDIDYITANAASACALRRAGRQRRRGEDAGGRREIRPRVDDVAGSQSERLRLLQELRVRRRLHRRLAGDRRATTRPTPPPPTGTTASSTRSGSTPPCSPARASAAPASRSSTRRPPRRAPTPSP